MTEQEQVFAGGGDMGALMRAKDWSQTPLGPVEDWPSALRIAIGVMLALPTPVALYWGRDFVMLYNDATRASIGAIHPAALGVCARTTFGPQWELLGGMFDHVTRTQTTVTVENQPIFLNRKGFAEEGYFTFSYAPLKDERAQSVGVFAIANETTGQVVGDRRLTVLRELSLQAAHAQDTERVLSVAGEVLAQSGHDIPFALLYREDGERFRLVVHSGLKAGTRATPHEVGSDEGASSWPLAEALRSHEAGLLVNVSPRVGEVHAGPWPEPVGRALLLPLALEGEPSPDAVLVLGLSPRLPLDTPYRDFLQLLSRQLVADMVRVRALEQEKQRAAQLAEMDRVKTAFFSNVSHEFRTPLTLMIGPTEAALDSPEQALRGEELRRVHRNELRLLKLVNSLLDLSRLEAGRTQGRFVPTDLASLTAGFASAFDSTITKAGLHLTVDCPALPEPLWVDPDLWEKVVLNLVSNAFKYTLKGEIAVRLRWKGTHVELSVQDTGTGIALEQQALIFERFHRVEGARGRSDEGTGIGLSLVRELVQLHGGRVRVVSVPGQGSTFTVELPTGRAHLPPERVLQEPPRVSTATGSRAFVQEAEQWMQATPEAVEELELPAPSGEGPRGRVLLVDDNADMRDYLARLLRGHFRVEAVADGQAALEAARAHPPDMVLSDVMMPRLDGFGLVRELKADARTVHVPVMLLSARASEKATLEGFAAGGVDYMVKPFRARELLARVGALMKTAQAQAELRAAQARMAGLIQNSPAFVCALSGPRHVFQVANPLYQQVVGEGRPLLGLTVREALPEVVEQGFIGLLDKVYTTGEPFFGREIPIQLRRRGDGLLEDAVVNFVYQPRRDAQGQVEGIDVFGFEVTEQVRARQRVEGLAERLRQSEERQRRVVEASGAGLWELDPATGYMRADPRMVELMGFAPGTAFDLKTGLDCVRAEDRESITRAIAGALAGENEGRYLVTFRVGGWDGMPERWVESRAQRLLGSDGKSVTLAGAIQDITARKQVEDARELAQQKLHAVFMQAPVAICILEGPEHTYTLANPRYRELVNGRDVVGKPILQALPELVGQGIDTVLDRVVATGEPYFGSEVPVKLRHHPEGETGYFNIVYSPKRDIEGRVDGVLVSATEVTDMVRGRRVAERAALEEKERREFEQQLLGIVSHDLRNPLSAIYMGVTLMMKREELDARASKSLLRIQSAAERAARMVKDLLDFTQARLGGGLRIDPQPMDLHLVTRGVLEEVETAWPTREMEVRHEGDGRGAWDADRLAQVVQNLVTNALKYSPEDSYVRVVTRAEKEEVFLSVANAGKPIPEDKLGSIFEPMQRATAEIDKSGRSVGLGLYIVKRIVDAHGGRISVTSTEAEGTVFTVSLPRQRP